MARDYPSDWTSLKFQHVSTKNNREKLYELELIEFDFSNDEAPILLMIPGYFQNAFVFDLLPQEDISFARHIASHFQFHMFVLHPNGIGQSDYIRKSDLDDIAIDDIAGAVSTLLRSYNKEIYLLGHSNGAISIQSYLSGLIRSPAGNIFDVMISNERQENISAAVLLAGNVCMTDDDKASSLKRTAKFGLRIKFILKRIGWINARLLTRFISPTKVFGRASVAYWNLWQFLYHIENVSRQSRKALYNQTLDGTSAATLIQYSEGVISGCINTTANLSYSEGLNRIHIPIVQTTFEYDPLAVPGPTKRDGFDKLASKRKLFIEVPQQGHEDFMMNKHMHRIINQSFIFLNEVTRAI